VLLLLPGFFGVADTCFKYILAFESDYRVISINYPETESSVAGLVNGLAAFLNTLGITQAHVVGGSYSGYIAQAFVRRYPERVRTLILAQTGAPRRKHWALAFGLASLAQLLPPVLARWLMRQSIGNFLPGSTPAQIFWRAYFRDLIQTRPYPALAHRFQTVLDYHGRYTFTATDLVNWPGEILILASAHESLFAPDDAAVMRQLYPHAHHLFVPGDHLHTVDQPEAQINALRQGLQIIKIIQYENSPAPC
jgi:pimeloyl-ACP methyl ester carboxylesterase